MIHFSSVPEVFVLFILGCYMLPVRGMDEAADLNMSFLAKIGLQFCANGQLILGIYFCDGVRDCHDGSDETGSECSASAIDEWGWEVCDGDRRISYDRMCDGYTDCDDHSDEICYAPECTSFQIACASVVNGVTCVHRSRVCDGKFDCIDMQDELDCPPEEARIQCDDGFKLCPNWECVAVENDCYGTQSNYTHDAIPNSEIVTPCHQQLSCHGSDICVELSRLCDGAFDCPQGDDERYCENRYCPLYCECNGLTYTCEEVSHLQFIDLPSDLRAIHFRMNNYFSIEYLNNALAQGRFIYMYSLTVKGSDLLFLPAGLLSELHNLRHVDFSDNALASLDKSFFSEKGGIRKVNLLNNPIMEVAVDKFIQHMTPNTSLIAELPTKYCCHLVKFLPHRIHTTCMHYLSIFSCFEMLPISGIVYPVLSTATLHLVLSIAMLVLCRLYCVKCKLQNMVVQGHAVAGVAMGLHTIILGAESVQYGDRYYLHDSPWRSSNMCSFISYLYTLATLYIAIATILAAVHQFVGTIVRKSYYYSSLETCVLGNARLCNIILLVVACVPTLAEKTLRYDTSLHNLLCASFVNTLLGQVRDRYAFIGLCSVELVAIITGFLTLLIFAVKKYQFIRRNQEKIRNTAETNSGLPSATRPGTNNVQEERKKLGGAGVEKAKHQNQQQQQQQQQHQQQQQWKQQQQESPLKRKTAQKRVTRREPDRPMQRSAPMLLCFFLSMTLLVSKNVCSMLALVGAVEFKYDFIIPFTILFPQLLHTIVVSAFTAEFSKKMLEHFFEERKRNNPFRLKHGQFVCGRTGRRFVGLDGHIGGGGRLSISQIIKMARQLGACIKDYHLEGRVCDKLDLTHVLMSIGQQDTGADFEVNTTTEYPKMDVSEWRMKRDVELFGHILDITLKHIKPAASQHPNAAISQADLA